jgi:hypothetical protein
MAAPYSLLESGVSNEMTQLHPPRNKGMKRKAIVGVAVVVVVIIIIIMIIPWP